MTPGLIQTMKGNAFDLLAPTSNSFDIEEIAHALAMQCRFNGHTCHPYSVAQHSVLVSELLETWGEPTDVLLCGLLHDAAEAYVGDVISPIKRLVPAYQAIEDRVAQALAGRYGVSFPFPAVVLRADAEMLNVERTALLPVLPSDPWALESEKPVPSISIDELEWAEAYDLFLSRFRELQRSRRSQGGA